jgi:hypothetical protein
MVESYAQGRENVILHMLDDDHQLLGNLEFIWRESAKFLELQASDL